MIDGQFSKIQRSRIVITDIQMIVNQFSKKLGFAKPWLAYNLTLAAIIFRLFISALFGLLFGVAFAALMVHGTANHLDESYSPGYIFGLGGGSLLCIIYVAVIAADSRRESGTLRWSWSILLASLFAPWVYYAVAEGISFAVPIGFHIGFFSTFAMIASAVLGLALGFFWCERANEKALRKA